MEKKTYIVPFVDSDWIETSDLLCASRDLTSENGIYYGGVDEGGTVEPESRRSLWDTEEDMW